MDTALLSSTTSSNDSPKPRKKNTTQTFLSKKARGETITMLTAYDYPTAYAIDQAGIDCEPVAANQPFR